MSFWYHLPFTDITHMPFPVIEAYLEHLPALQAEMRLVLLDVTTFPHLEARARRRALKHMERQATRHQPERAIVAPPAWLRLKGVGIDLDETRPTPKMGTV